MLVDYHTHNRRCGHAEGELAEYIEAAIAAGLDEIGLSDHSPIYHLPVDHKPLFAYAMGSAELPGYVAEMAALRDRYAGRIDVRLSVESDHIDGWEEHYRALWQQYPLDYVIGSVHWLGEWNIFEPELPPGETREQVYSRYLAATRSAARSGIFDIIGHLDGLKTKGYLPAPDLVPELVETVQVLADSGVAIELNTSGWRKTCADCYPRAGWLTLCRRHGVPVTLSSDAHRPADVAYRFADAVRLLREVGYTEMAVFQDRRRRMVPLP